MLEIANIFIYGIFIFILFLFPFNFSFTDQYIKKVNLNFFDIICLNVLFQFSIYLILSFFIPDISNVIRAIFLISFFFIFIDYKKFELKKNYFLFLLIIFFLILFFSINIHIASNPRLSWDGVAHWFWKTRSFYYGFGLENFKNLPNSMYPHLGTYLWSNFWKISFVDYEYFGRFYYTFIFLLAIFSILCSVRSKYIFIIILFSTFLAYEPYVLGGYQEYLVFFFISFVARLFFLFSKNFISKNLFFTFFLLSLTLLLWSKQEGIFYSALLLTVFILSLKSENKEKIFISSSLLLILITHITIEYYFKGSKGFHEPIVNNFDKLKNINLFISSVLYISQGILIGFCKRPIIIICIFAYFFTKYFKKEKISISDFNLVFFIINILFIFSIYLHTHFGIESILPQTLGRLLIHTSGFYLVSLVYLLDFFYKKNVIKK